MLLAVSTGTNSWASVVMSSNKMFGQVTHKLNVNHRSHDKVVRVLCPIAARLFGQISNMHNRCNLFTHIYNTDLHSTSILSLPISVKVLTTSSIRFFDSNFFYRDHDMLARYNPYQLLYVIKKHSLPSVYSIFL